MLPRSYDRITLKASTLRTSRTRATASLYMNATMVGMGRRCNQNSRRKSELDTPDAMVVAASEHIDRGWFSHEIAGFAAPCQHRSKGTSRSGVKIHQLEGRRA